MGRMTVYNAEVRFSELVERKQGGRSTVITTCIAFPHPVAIR